MYDPYETNENNYYRTWQLQQRAHHQQQQQQQLQHQQQRASKQGELPPPPYHPISTSSSEQCRYVDHVYESPKFDRRDFPGSCSSEGGYGSQQYYELDPDVVDSQIQQQPIPHHRQAKNSLTGDICWMRRDDIPEVMMSPR